MDPDLAGVRAFVVVAEELHFGRAALRLGVSQPQVSRRVRGLEATLGVELFARTARQTVLTEAGERLLQPARDTLSAADRLAEAAARTQRDGGGRVAVAFYWSTLAGYLPPLVAAAAERHPEIELSVVQSTYLELPPALRRGDVDLAIARPTYATHDDLCEIELCPEAGVLALAADHPLAATTTLRRRDLHGVEMIALARELVPAAYDAVTARLAADGIAVDIIRHVRSAAEALALVSAGIGAFRLAASSALPVPGVVYREIVDSPSRLVLIHRVAPRPPVSAVIDLAIQLFGDADRVSKHAPVSLVSGRAAP